MQRKKAFGEDEYRKQHIHMALQIASFMVPVSFLDKTYRIYRYYSKPDAVVKRCLPNS